MNQETLAKMIELQMDYFNKTRDTKTKINLALWTFFALLAGFRFVNNAAPPPPRWISIAIDVVVLALCLIHVIWMRRIQDSLDFDKAQWSRYRQLLESNPVESRDRAEIPRKKPLWRRLSWVLIESGTTVALAALACLGLWQ